MFKLKTVFKCRSLEVFKLIKNRFSTLHPKPFGGASASRFTPSHSTGQAFHGVSGLSLLEAILALAIVGVGLIGIMFVFSGGARSSLVANETVVASNLAKEKLEQVIADRANKGYAYVIANAGGYSDGQLPGNFSAYTRNVTILEVDPDDDNSTDDFLDPAPGSGYARVTTVVSWSGATESVKLETLIAEYVMP
ncbi:MAG: hypothetical protein ABIE74_09760 [Pseudomonadota bacterium]